MTAQAGPTTGPTTGPTPTPTIGFVGVGGMGANMVRRLAACGYRVVAHDIDVERARGSVGDVAGVASDLAGVTDQAEVLCTSLPDPATVRAVYLGGGRSEEGIVAHARPGATLVDLSTVDPFTSREVARQAAEHGLGFLDCPVSGGPREAGAGELVMFAGGEGATLAAVRDVLACLAPTIHHIGASGAGATVKMVNNVIANGTVLLTAEAFVLGVRLGLDPDELFSVLMTAGARSHHFAKRFPNALAGNFEPGYKLALARKDMALALDVGRTLRMPLSVTGQMHELFTAAVAQGHENEDYVSVIKYFEELAGVTARGREAQT